MAINSDITAAKRAQQELVTYAEALKTNNEELGAALETARQANEVKTQFLRNMSHELRTPLNSIIGFSQLLRDGVVGKVTDDQKDCLADVLSCSEHLLTLIADLLDTAKIEAGKMAFQYEDVALDQLVGEAVDCIRAIAVSNGVAVRVQCDDRIGQVQVDRSKIKRVILNFLSNALKFTARNSVVLVDVRREDDASYRIQVEDNGIGIRPEDLPRLFTEFGQVGAGEKAGGGTGLGLAISKRIVEAHGGRVGVESVFGEGSRFYAVLPVRQQPALALPLTS
jgi:signal transduction histidine kinase